MYTDFYVQPPRQHIMEHLKQGAPSLTVGVASLNLVKRPTHMQKNKKLKTHTSTHSTSLYIHMSKPY